jgi:hypothetical protein
VSATDRSLVQSSPTDCGVSERKPPTWGGLSKRELLSYGKKLKKTLNKFNQKSGGELGFSTIRTFIFFATINKESNYSEMLTVTLK